MDDKWKSKALFIRLVVLESGLGLESGLKSIFAGLGLGLELSIIVYVIAAPAMMTYQSYSTGAADATAQCCCVSRPQCNALANVVYSEVKRRKSRFKNSTGLYGLDL